jgi:hypothetical protein
MTPRNVLCALLCCVVLSQGVAAPPPYQLVSFQGRLSNAGTTAPNGSYDMLFKFYDAATNGTLLLTDRHLAPANPVTVSSGLYSVFLGGGEIVAGSESNLWNVFLRHPQVYLGISVASEGEMTPRLLLTHTPYAVRAEDALTISGKSATQFVQVASNGSATISGSYRFSAAKTNRVTLGPADFKPRHPSEEQFILWGYPWKTNRHYLICTRETGFSTFHAEVHVPEGAILTKLVSYVYDVDSARNSILNLARCSLFGHLGPDPVYLVTNNSMDNQVRVERPLNEVVNTTTNHYVLSLQLPWSDLGMQFLGAQVEYTYTDLKN